MAPKASSSKRAASTQEEPKIQLRLEIEDNNNIVDIREQIRALIASQEANRLKARNTQETLQEILESLTALQNSPASPS